MAPKSHIGQSCFLFLFSSLQRSCLATRQLFLSLSRLSSLATILFRVAEPVSGGNVPLLNNIFRIVFNLQEAQSHCKFLYQPPLKAGTSHFSVRSGCSGPCSATFKYLQEWRLHSPLEQPVSTLDQPHCENIVYKRLTSISAVATSVRCALPFHCLCVPFRPLYATLDFVFPEMLGHFLGTVFHWIHSNKMFGFLLDH